MLQSNSILSSFSFHNHEWILWTIIGQLRFASTIVESHSNIIIWNAPEIAFAISSQATTRIALSPFRFKMSVAEAINSARKIELWKVCQNIFLRVGILKVPWESTAKALGITFWSIAKAIWEVYYQRKSKRKRELVQLYHLPSDSAPSWMNVQVIQPLFCWSHSRWVAEK